MNKQNKYSEVKDWYKSHFENVDRTHLLLSAIQTKGQDKFAELDFPTRKNEEWKYTDVKSVLADNYIPVLKKTEIDVENIEVENFKFKNFDAELLVFVDGIFSEELSEISELPEGVIVGSLNAELKQNQDMILPHLSDYIKIDNAFNALNTALISDGAVMIVPDNVVLERPVQILYLSGNKQTSTLAVPRNLFLFGKNSEAKIIANFQCSSETNYFTNSVTELALDENSKVDYIKVQNESRKAYHIDKTEVHQKKHSRFRSFSFSFGGELVRNDLNAVMNSEDIETHFYGLYLADGKRHVDNHTFADHAFPNCYSNEVYKGLLMDESTGVFNGKIMVRTDAQQTNAYQTNKTILLSDKAKMDTKPQLEIYADDVKCSHGATVGNVDDLSLFYLQARGIPKKVAQMMLIKGFVFDVLEPISIGPLKEELSELIISNIKF